MTTPPANARTHVFRTVLPSTSVQALEAFHAAPNAFSTLTPPPIFIQMHRRDLPTLTAGSVDFTMWIGPVPVRWLAQHSPGPIATSFVDEQARGPMAYWRHEHRFEAVPGGARLTDQVTIAHRPGWRGLLTRLMFDGLPLRLFFFYRHLRTRLALRGKA